MEDRSPFADVRFEEDGAFSIPELKWRELVFIGALAPDGDAWVRDPARPLPPFKIPDLFPEARRFRAEKTGTRVVLRSAPRPGAASRG